MKLKKLLAGVIAGALAVSAMSAAAFALENDDYNWYMDEVMLNQCKIGADNAFVIEYDSPNGGYGVGSSVHADGGLERARLWPGTKGIHTMTITIADAIKSVADPSSITHGKIEGENGTKIISVKLLKEVVPDTSTPVDTDVSTPVDTDVSTPVDTDVSTPVDTDVSTPVDTDVSTPVDTDDSTPVNTDDSTPVDTEDTTPVVPGKSDDNKGDDKNPATGVALIALPVILAAAGMTGAGVILKKRK